MLLLIIRISNIKKVNYSISNSTIKTAISKATKIQKDKHWFTKMKNTKSWSKIKVKECSLRSNWVSMTSKRSYSVKECQWIPLQSRASKMKQRDLTFQWNHLQEYLPSKLWRLLPLFITSKIMYCALTDLLPMLKISQIYILNLHLKQMLNKEWITLK